MEVSVLVALLTLLGSCCVGLVLLVILIVVVALLLSGRVKKAEVSGLGAKVALEGMESPKPEALADTPASSPISPTEKHPRVETQQAGVIIREGATVSGSLFERVAGGDIHEVQEGK